MSSHVTTHPEPKTEMTYAVLAEFADPTALMQAAEKVRDAGYRDFDCHSPFPIHGMDAAMGLKRSPIGYIAGITAFLFGSGAMALQLWINTVDYKLVIAGKPFASVPAFIIVTFGLTILGAALGAVFGMFICNRLPQPFHGLFYSERFQKVTNDGFFVSIEATDPKFDSQRVSDFLRSIGGNYVEVVRGE